MKSTDAFAELGRIRFHETTFDNVLTQICVLARRTIPAATDVSVTLVGSGGAHTAAGTGGLGRIWRIMASPSRGPGFASQVG